MSIFLKTTRTPQIKKSIKERFYEAVATEMRPSKIAGGIAFGIFAGLSPFYGLHFIMAVVFSFLFRLNKLTAVLGTLANNPLTMVPLIFAQFKLGVLITGMHGKGVAGFTDLIFEGEAWGALVYAFENLTTFGYPFLVGSLVSASVAGAAAYFPFYFIVKRIKDRQARPVPRDQSGENEEP